VSALPLVSDISLLGDGEGSSTSMSKYLSALDLGMPDSRSSAARRSTAVAYEQLKSAWRRARLAARRAGNMEAVTLSPSGADASGTNQLG